MRNNSLITEETLTLL